MAERAESETLKPSFGIAALWEKVAEALLVSATAVLEGAEWSFSASVVAEQLEESGAEVMSSSLLYSILIVSGMDIQLSGGKKKYQLKVPRRSGAKIQYGNKTNYLIL